MRLTLRTDGGARRNPGPSAAGVVIEGPGGATLARLGRFLGRGTNNEAEYRALIIGLEEALARGAREVEVLIDSQLVQRHIQGLYKAKAANLVPLLTKARGLLGRFESSRVRYVPRKENKEADRLVNLALDSGADVDEPCTP